MDQIRKEEENILKEYQTAMKQKAEQEKRMHEAVHTEIQEERLKGQLLWNSLKSEMRYTGFGKFNKEEEGSTHQI